MGDELQALQSRIGQFHAAMLANDIDARYGLVEFRDWAKLQQDFVDFESFVAPTAPFPQLERRSGEGWTVERGSDAILVGLTESSPRPNAVLNLILFSDEDDQSTFETFLAADRLLGESGALFNAIANPDYRHTSTGVGNVLERYGFLAETHGGELFDLREFMAGGERADSFFDYFTAAKVHEIQSAARVPEPSGGLAFSLLLLPMLFLLRRART